MKTTYFTIAITALSVCVAELGKAQENVAPGRDGYIEFSGGLAMPMGPYMSANNSIPGGYAEPGSSFNCSFGITPEHFPVGIALMAGYYSNGVNLTDYLNNLHLSDLSASYTSSTASSTLFYSGFYGMAGLYKDIDMGNVSVDIRALAGSLGATSPEISFFALQPGTSTESAWNISSAKGADFCYDLGATARINTNSPVSFFINLDYIYSDIYSFTTYDTYYTSSGYINYSPNTTLTASSDNANSNSTHSRGGAGSNTYVYTQSSPAQNSMNMIISFVNIGVGVGFRL